MYEKTFPNRRFKITLDFLQKHVSKEETILDLGVENPFSKIMTEDGSKTDMWDRHYHEFEDWQLDWLLEKTGWKIIAREKFTNPVNKIGFRPLLRKVTPRYYIVAAERIK